MNQYESSQKFLQIRTKNLIRCYISSPSHNVVSFISSLVCHLGHSDKYSSNHVDHSLSVFVKKERQDRTQWKQKTTLSIARTHARTYMLARARNHQCRIVQCRIEILHLLGTILTFHFHISLNDNSITIIL